ncbi:MULTISPECIES: DUF1059 domain-containing protein [Haloarcula]|nr:DUF1059 domain-containing protein [Halomicroarcula sp. XH51]
MAHQYCEFQVRSEDQDEVIELVRTHAQDMHDESSSADQVRDGIQSV